MTENSLRETNYGNNYLSNRWGGTLEVNIPRRPKQPARTATLELRWAPMEIIPPRVGCKNSWGPITLYALEAKEVHPPAGVDPIEWVLLTDWKIDSLKTACRLVRWYGLRWGIECWHQVLKDGCGVETRQMKTAQALTRSLVLDMIMAWRVLLLCRLGKSHPNLPASVFYGPEELAILEILKKKAPCLTALMPTLVPVPKRHQQLRPQSTKNSAAQRTARPPLAAR